MSKAPYTISDLSREFEVTTRTLRFYEDKGLISPQREGQTRLYSHKDKDRIEMILRGKNVGFSLDEIKDMLELSTLKGGESEQLRISLEINKDSIKILEDKRRDIDEAVIELQKFAQIVESLLNQATAK
jgi:DNA-binding transcriptional MerR regulator